MQKPPQNVLHAFDAVTEPVPLKGGQGEAFRSGSIVLKPAVGREEAEWCGAVLTAIRQDGFRTPRPIRAADGSFYIDGWTVFEFLEGETAEGRLFEERLAASRAFHLALAGLPKPAFLDRRENPWSVADRITWGFQDWVSHARVAPVLNTLRRLERPIHTPCQIVHGDIAGNMLIDQDLPPAVIDFTPYWTPAGFGEAVFVVDAVLWEGADLRSLLDIAGIDARLVVRAAIRRLLEVDCHHRLRGLSDASLDEVDRYKDFASDLAGRLHGV